ncbi:MAG: fused MFS/spermidine synthase, partial [Myxococcota bacterium]
RAAIGEDDVSRRTPALLYGLNTLGAVVGASVSTFLLLKIFGARFSLWFACLINALVALAARWLDRRFQEQDEAAREEQHAAPEVGHEIIISTTAAATTPPAPLDSTLASNDEERERLRAARALTPFVLTAAGGVGFSFLLMELVWYRVLSPLLGGSSYTFGLILAVALFGIGIGGLLYTLTHKDRPPLLAGFAMTCALEAILIASPYALGDRIALLALHLHPLGIHGLGGHLLGWTVVTAIVVLPAAIVSGFQFPLLIALLGRARVSVGRHVGRAYAANTVGAIVGSLAGGFFLIPRLGALGAWRMTVWILVLLGAASLFLHAQLETERRFRIGPALTALVTLAMLHGSVGPTAFWRHSPIGAGRANGVLASATINGVCAAMDERRQGVSWSTDGRESAVALYDLNDTAFLVNGKSDGAAVLDGGTQVMGGVLPALLQPEPVRRALVIGLGTGSTAGWLATLPSVERVDVVELEPAILDVARRCEAVNNRVLDNPKVNVIIGDAREVLLTTPERYDLIFSEPSNPYRAGIASLFTQEFYRAVEARLAD